MVSSLRQVAFGRSAQAIASFVLNAFSNRLRVAEPDSSTSGRLALDNLSEIGGSADGDGFVLLRIRSIHIVTGHAETAANCSILPRFPESC